MLNTPTRSNIQRYTLTNRAADMPERLPVSDDARNGLSSLWIGVLGTLTVAAIIFISNGFKF